jgi:hypothetical protein
MLSHELIQERFDLNKRFQNAAAVGPGYPA